MKEAQIKIFAGTSNFSLAQEVAEYIKSPLSALEVKRFSDGEISVKVKENVRGADVFFIQSTSLPANDHLMELMLVVDALRRSSARRITVVVPYYGYARQDRKVEPRVPISAKVVANMLEGVGVNRVLCIDLHSDQIQGFFEIPVDHLFSAPVLIEYFQHKKISDLVIVSPDSGGAERARFFAKQLNAEMAIIDKRRQKENVAEVMNVIGNVKGRNCLLIDDMIDTAGTICKAAEALKEQGAFSVFAGATHAVLSGPAISRIEDSMIDEMVLTNTIQFSKEKKLKNITILSVAKLMGEAINRIHKEESVSSLFL